jgi:hypothetical protein
MTVEQVLHHPYVTDNDTIDPFALHALDALPLPRTNSGPGGGDSGGKNEDKEWARRQCSIVWAPMPMSYDLSSTVGRGKVRPVDPLAPLLSSESTQAMSGTQGSALEGAIFETEIEFGSKF